LNKNRLGDIEELRGLGVSLIVIYYTFPWLLPGGFIGVDIFFVILGFLISKIIQKQIFLTQV
jgi:peptidoglycan/LPS O-acetylase OafA/YrhL